MFCPQKKGGGKYPCCLSSSLKYIGMDSIVTNKAEEIENARRIILPGVGAFRNAVARLRRTGLVPVIHASL